MHKLRVGREEVLNLPYIPYIGRNPPFFTLPFTLHPPYMVVTAEPYIFKNNIV